MLHVEIIALLVCTNVQCTDDHSLACHSLCNLSVNLELFFLCWEIFLLQINKLTSEKTDSTSIILNDCCQILDVANISVQEVRKIKEIVEEVKAELTSQGVEFGDPEQGIMIETPAAAIISDDLAKEVDFFSIGTNDLSQYTMAIDRQNPQLDLFFDPHHPAVLRMISLVVENAHKAGIWAGICGELGADQSLTKEFLAMGVDELSVSPGSILPLRKIILETNVTDYKAGKEC